jgi:hypothetical protein
MTTDNISNYGKDILAFLQGKNLNTNKYVKKKTFGEEMFAAQDDMHHFRAHSHKCFHEFNIYTDGIGLRTEFEDLLEQYFAKSKIFVMKYLDINSGIYILITNEYLVTIIYDKTFCKMRLFKYSQLDKNHFWQIYELGSGTNNRRKWQDLHYVYWLKNLPLQTLRPKDNLGASITTLDNDVISKIINENVLNKNFKLSENIVNTKLNEHITKYYSSRSSTSSPMSSKSSPMSSKSSPKSSKASYKSK